jgi:hypothetical protein
MCGLSRNCGSLYFLEPYGPLQARIEIVLLLLLVTSHLFLGLLDKRLFTFRFWD